MPDMPAPTVRPFDARMLDVGDGHWLYVEEIGTRGGRPAIFLHGGPGSGAQHGHRTLFDCERDHAFLFDQRGAGRSHPYLDTSANTTDHLVRDIEAIRTHFEIDRWLVVGGSWGSTLALAYAQAHPERVTGLVLRAIFLGTREEVRWAFVDAPQTFRPELYDAFVAALPEDERRDPLQAYIDRLTNRNPEIHGPAARTWNAYERILSELTPPMTTLALPASELSTSATDSARIPPTPLIEAHYIANNFFLANNQLLQNAHRLSAIPGRIIQGRYDLLCPPASALALAALWPAANVQIMDAAGHAMTEPGVTDAMRRAISELQSAAR